MSIEPKFDSLLWEESVASIVIVDFYSLFLFSLLTLTKKILLSAWWNLMVPKGAAAANYNTQLTNIQCVRSAISFQKFRRPIPDAEHIHILGNVGASKR